MKALGEKWLSSTVGGSIRSRVGSAQPLVIILGPSFCRLHVDGVWAWQEAPAARLLASRRRSWSGVWQRASGAEMLFSRFVGLCLQFGEALGADRLDEGLEMPHAVGEPFQLFFGDLVVL